MTGVAPGARLRGCIVLVVLVLGASGCAASSRARPPTVGGETDARALAATAQAHFDRGAYQVAAAELREAYRLHPGAGLLYNLGQAYRLAGACADATAAYRAYLRAAPGSRHRSTVARHLASLRGCAADPAQRIAGRRRVAGVAIAVTGAALLGAGGWVSVDGGAARRGDEDQAGSGRTVPLLGAALLGAGGVALGAGVTLYLVGRRDQRRAPTVTVVPVPGRSSAAVLASWRF